MSAKKFYAVRKGKKPGIYTTWENCKRQIDGFSGAEYKGFPSYSEAEEYLGLYLSTDREVKNDVNGENVIIAYIDGSYSEELKMFSYACLFIDNDKTTLSGTSSEESVISMRNVAGELKGAMVAIKWATEKKYQKIELHYDYEGIEKWANGSWSANKEGTRKYIEFITNYRSLIDISFVKVKAHSGNQYNELVDSIAKRAIEEHKLKGTLVTEPVDNILKIFEKVILSKEKSKKPIIYKVIDYEFTDNKMKKLLKEICKEKSVDFKSVIDYNITVEADNRTLKIEIVTEGNTLQSIINF